MARARKETTDPAYPLGISPKTIFVTGKGGVGKSTTAAALAIAYRDAGVRTLLVDLAGQASAAVLISKKSINYEPVALSPRLWGIRFDPAEALKEYARLQLKVKRLADALVSNPVFRHFAGAAPGFRELLILGKIWELAQRTNGRGQQQFEAIIVDAPSTGHGVGLLGMAGMVARAFPVGPIATQARIVDAFVKDRERCGIVVVALPEEIPVNETIDLVDRLETQDVGVGGIVANRVIQQRLDDSGVASVSAALTADHDDAVRHVLETAMYEHARRVEQLIELNRLVVIDIPIAQLEELYCDTIGAQEVGLLAEHLLAPDLFIPEVPVQAGVPA